MKPRHTLRALPLVALLAASGTVPAAAETTRSGDGPYAVLAGGAVGVEYDCGFYLDCERATGAVLRAALGWRWGPTSVEAWLLRLRDTAVGDAYVVRTLRLSGWGGVAVFHFGATERSEWQWRLGLLSMRHERTDDGVNTDPAGLLGLGWSLALTPQTQLQLAWDITRADGNNVSTTVLHLVTVGLRQRF